MPPAVGRLRLPRPLVFGSKPTYPLPYLSLARRYWASHRTKRPCRELLHGATSLLPGDVGRNRNARFAIDSSPARWPLSEARRPRCAPWPMVRLGNDWTACPRRFRCKSAAGALVRSGGFRIGKYVNPLWLNDRCGAEVHVDVAGTRSIERCRHGFGALFLPFASRSLRRIPGFASESQL